MNQNNGTITPVWLAVTMLVFMAPTILAYGRIMGASWNMLLLNKWRTANGRRNPIDPDKPSFVNRLFSLLRLLRRRLLRLLLLPPRPQNLEQTEASEGEEERKKERRHERANERKKKKARGKIERRRK